MNNDNTVIATPNPSFSAVTSASGFGALLGWGAITLGAKWHVPAEIVGAGLTAMATAAGSVWSRFFGPGVPVQKS
jgi:hypothetical protein